MPEDAEEEEEEEEGEEEEEAAEMVDVPVPNARWGCTSLIQLTRSLKAPGFNLEPEM
jgi:hypothetical protein